MRVKTVLMYDPPAGWMYGFPKPYEPLEGEGVTDTLLRDGYPKDMLSENPLGVRFYSTEIMVPDDEEY